MEVEECGQNCPASANLCQRAVCCATAASSNLAQARWKKPLAAHLRLQLENAARGNRKTGRPLQQYDAAARKRCGLSAVSTRGIDDFFSFLLPSRSSSPPEEKPT